MRRSRPRAGADASGEELWVIYAGVCADGGAGRRGRGASSALLCVCMNGGSGAPSQWLLLSSSPVSGADRRAEPRAEERGRDGREQLRGERLRSPEVHGPFAGEEQFGRCIEMDPAKRRRDVFSNDEADAVPRSKIIPVQIKPG